MANDGLAGGLVRTPRATWIEAGALFAFLILAFVGLSPFAVHAPSVTEFGQNGTTGAGDVARQVCYLVVFAAIVIGALRLRGLEAFTKLVQRAGWKITKIIDRPLSHDVLMEKA